MIDVMQSLHEEHRNMSKLLNVLERQIEEFDRGGSPDYGIIKSILDYSLEYSDLYHHPKEDLVFQRLRDRYPDAINSVNDLEEDHRKLAARTRKFVEAIQNVIEGAELPRDRVMSMAREFLDAQRRHMEMEDQWVFPAAEQYLTAEDWAEISAEASDRDDPLFGPQVEAMYRTLHEEILESEEAA
jgi:hemerythrin-like domain-containing protein